MSSAWAALWTGVAGDAVYTLLAAIAASLVALSLVRRQRRRLLSFFGIHHKNSKVKIYLSRVEVLPGGSKGTDGPLNRGFTGPALVQLEYRGALEVRQLLRSPLLDSVPLVWRSLVEARASRISSANVWIEPSPGVYECQHIFDSSDDTVILLGSDVYSHAVRSVYERKLSFVRLVSEASGRPYFSNGDDAPTFAVDVGGLWEVIPARSVGREIATIQRITWENGCRLFMCSGISASTTYASTKYLCSHWRSFSDRFGENDFLVVLESPNQQADSDQLQDPSELPGYEQKRMSHTASHKV